MTIPSDGSSFLSALNLIRVTCTMPGRLQQTNEYSHLGHNRCIHIFNDLDHIANRRHYFIGQASTVLRLIYKLSLFVRLKLFKSWCSSMYGCELWAFNYADISAFLGKKAKRPFVIHSNILVCRVNSPTQEKKPFVIYYGLSSEHSFLFFA